MDLLSLSPNGKKKKCSRRNNDRKLSEANHNIAISEEYDYKQLLTANLNLVDVIDAGKDLYFDCPPMNFNQIDYSKLSWNEL